jgi:hypothetical protein
MLPVTLFSQQLSRTDISALGRAKTLQVEDPVVILGFGPQGQMLANMLSSPLAQSGNKTRTYIGFDLDHTRVTASRRAGFNVAYGNGARPGVLKAAGVWRLPM